MGGNSPGQGDGHGCVDCRSGSGRVIEARGIRNVFGATEALAGLDLTAHAGRVLARLGPNGAGKTTLVRILTTLLRADEGWARVAGFDVQRDAAAFRSPLVSGSTDSCACSKIRSESAEPADAAASAASGGACSESPLTDNLPLPSDQRALSRGSRRSGLARVSSGSAVVRTVRASTVGAGRADCRGAPPAIGGRCVRPPRI
ncbi:MAG TPA: ATP-binding cassette domain-containing protein [Chloroflexota bacterium]